MKVIICAVEGNLGHMWLGDRKVSAMCDKCRCSSNECSAEPASCEHQVIKEKEDEEK
ncbi:hypothetical protein VPHD441_0055 [Vibrio phage D441]|nr:hypothetical protein SIPHO035v1_p0047 [Vibrio phage 234P7B]QZI88690.1 hypothetical protein SIPHO039v1_p0061 [Vibrio phage 70E35.5a]